MCEIELEDCSTCARCKLCFSLKAGLERSWKATMKRLKAFEESHFLFSNLQGFGLPVCSDNALRRVQPLEHLC